MPFRNYHTTSGIPTKIYNIQKKGLRPRGRSAIFRSSPFEPVAARFLPVRYDLNREFRRGPLQRTASHGEADNDHITKVRNVQSKSEESQTSKERFQGRIEKAFDKKGRLVMPQNFRALLPTAEANRVIVVQGCQPGERYLEVWPIPEWNGFVERVERIDSVVHRRALWRGYISHAQIFNLDEDGRLVLPATYRDYAGLKENVYWLGSGNMMELWAKEKLDPKQDDFSAQAWTALVENQNHL